MKTELRNYGVSSTIDFVLYALDGIKFAPSVSFAVGDIKLSLDEGAEVNSTNLPVLVGRGYSLTLTAAEQAAARISVKISDQTATQVWLDTAIEIETYGNALAQHEVFPSNIVQIDGDTVSAQNLKNQYDGTTGLVGDLFPFNQDQGSGVSDLPNTAAFEARTLLSAEYATLTNQTSIEDKVDIVDTNVDAVKVDTTSLISGQTTINDNVLANKVLIEDVPNNAEFEARTLLAAEYGTSTKQTSIENKVDAVGTVTTDTNTKIIAIPADVDTELSANHGAGNWEGGGGGGGTDWSSNEREQIRDALGVDGSKATATGGQLQDKFETGDYVAPDNSTIGTIDAKVDAIGTIVSDQPNTADFESRTLPSADYFDPANDVVANVALVDVTTLNTDMRGTNNALLASSYVAPDNTAIGIIDGKVDALGVSVGDLPNTADFESRTLPSDDYFDFSSDEVTINSTSINGIFAGGDVDGYSLDEALRVVVASSAGKTSGSGATAFTIRNVSDTKDVISATVDLIGNRTATIVDAS